MQQRDCRAARQHRDRLEPQRVHERVDLPVAEVPGEEEHALALRVRRAGALLALELDAAQHRVGRSVLNFSSSSSRRPKWANISRVDRPALVGRALRETPWPGWCRPRGGARDRTGRTRSPSSRAARRGPARGASRGRRRAPGARPRSRADASCRGVRLPPCSRVSASARRSGATPRRCRPVRHARRGAATPPGTASGRNGSRRTMSFSVVSTTPLAPMSAPRRGRGRGRGR